MRLVEPEGCDASRPLSIATYRGDRAAKTGLYGLDEVELFNMLCIPPDQPGVDTPPTVYEAAAAYCVAPRHADPRSAERMGREVAEGQDRRDLAFGIWSLVA